MRSDLRRATPEDFGHESTGILCPACERHELGRVVNYYLMNVGFSIVHRRSESLSCGCGFTRTVNDEPLSSQESVDQQSGNGG